MYSIEHELSKLRYTNEDAKLKLESTCLLKLSSCQMLNVASTASDGLLEFLDTAGWIARGNGLRLCIYLALEQACISNLFSRALVEHLASSLQDPEVVPLCHLLHPFHIDFCAHAVLPRIWFGSGIEPSVLDWNRRFSAT